MLKNAKESNFPLFEALPGLKNQIHRVDMGVFPTPLEKMETLEKTLNTGANLYIKRDDQSSPLYGGNKVRKMEFTLGRVLQKGSRRIITGGGLGSHMTIATAAFGKAHGIPTDVVLFKQPINEHVKKNMKLNHYFDARMEYSSNYISFAMDIAKRYALATLEDGKPPYLIMPGDSNALSSLGYVNTAFEIKQQIEAGEMPEPDYIYVAAGSGGTMAGLLVGLRLAGLKTKVVGVLVSEKLVTNTRSVTRLANETLEFLRENSGTSLPGISFSSDDVIILPSYLGQGYGHETPKSQQSIALLKKSENINLDPTYTSKAMAALIDFARLPQSAGKNIMFLNTYNSRDLSDEAAAIAPRDLPRDFRRFFS